MDYKVSVIVPVYKVEKYLPQCIESLQAQSIRDIEIILVDDGSPDASPQICDAYAANDSRIRVLHKENAGVLQARQSGLELASAPYVGFMDSDDFAAADMYEKLWHEAEKQKAQVVCCSIMGYWSDVSQYRYAQSETLSGVYRGEKLVDFYNRFFFDNSPHSENESIAPSLCSKLFDRELITKYHSKYAREGTGLTVGEDMIVSYSCLLNASCISVLGDFYPIFYRQHAASVMNSYRSDYLANTEKLLVCLEKLEMPAEARRPVSEAVCRFANHLALRILRGQFPPASTFMQRMRITNKYVRYLHSDPQWKKRLHKQSGLFASRYEDCIYRLMLAGMPRTIVFCESLYRIWKQK